jgi:hypothetical protein
MTARSNVIGLAVVAMLALTSFGWPTPGPAERAAARTTQLCKSREWKAVDGGKLIAYNDVFAANVHSCMNLTASDRFTLSHMVTPVIQWGAYPNLYSGCENGICTTDTSLPARVSSIRSLSMTLYTRYPTGIGDDATDFWFTQHDPRLDKFQHPSVELMLWLGWRGIRGCTYSRNGFTLADQHWCAEYWIANNGEYSWQYIQLRWFPRNPHAHPSVTRLNVLAIIRWCERQGLMSRSLWASSFDAGFEIVLGGNGDRILKYALYVSTKRR